MLTLHPVIISLTIFMKNVLVIGSTGQIGSELTRELRKRYGNG